MLFLELTSGFLTAVFKLGAAGRGTEKAARSVDGTAAGGTSDRSVPRIYRLCYYQPGSSCGNSLQGESLWGRGDGHSERRKKELRRRRKDDFLSRHLPPRIMVVGTG